MDAQILLPPVYEVRGGPYKGGMGCVWQVWHREWETLLAVKQPLVPPSKDSRVRSLFLSECELWVSLGLHEHIVLCHYVRDIGETPTVFAEWMEGGSLQERIEYQSLYDAPTEGAEAVRATQLRLLDLSVQIARGMAYAHGRGLVHRDLKPANVLLSSNGTAKITDFGLSVLRDGSEDAGRGFGTAAYAAPEQQRGESVGPQADLWSFGVMLLELFLGERLWTNSRFVPMGLEDYFAHSRVGVPREVERLVRCCCNVDASKRPSSFVEAERLLTLCWERVAGSDYPRRDAGSTGLVAGSWNNRALSYLDLGREDEAEECWAKALRADPGHMASVYNQTMCRWREGKLDDLDAMRRLQNAYNNAPCPENGELLARFFTERQSAEPIAKIQKLFGSKLGTSSVPLGESSHAKGAWDGGFFLTTRSVRAMACGGSEVALFFADGTAQRWDVRRRLCLCDLELRGAHSNDAVFLFDGTLCVACDDGLLLLGQDGRFLKRLAVPEGLAYHVFRCSGEDVLLHARRVDGQEDTKDYAIRLSIADGTRHAKIRFDNLGSDLFLPLDDGRELLVATKAHVLSIRLESGRICGRYAMGDASSRAHDGLASHAGIHCGAIDKDENLLAVALDDVVSVRSLRDDDDEYVLHAGRCVALSFLRNGSLLLTADDERVVRLWEVRTGRCLRTFPTRRGRIAALCVTQDEDAYVCAGLSDGAYVQHVPPFQERSHLKLSRVRDVSSLQEDERRFKRLVEEAASHARHGDIADALQCLCLARHIRGYERHPAYLRLNAALGKGLKVKRILSVWCRREVEDDRKARRKTDSLSGTDAQGHRAFRARHDGEVVVDGTSDARSYRTGFRDVSAAALSNGGHLVALGSFDGRLGLFDCRNARLLWQKREARAMVCTIAFAPIGGFLLAGYAEGTMVAHDLSDGHAIKVLSGHRSPIVRLRFSPDGLMLRSDEEAGCVRIWQFDYEYGL